MTKLYPFSRKIHRFLIWIITPLALAMMATGIVMQTPALLNFVPVKFSTIFTIHTTLSLTFAVFLSLMLMTGLTMYVYPLLTRHTPPTTHQS